MFILPRCRGVTRIEKEKTTDMKVWERLNKFFGAQDMTVGKPMRNLLTFSIPLLIGNFAQQLYSTADSIIVGKYVGDTALSAVGATIPIITMINVLFIAISTGTGVMVSQFFGARQSDKLSESVGNSITLVLLSSALLMAIFVPTSMPLLSFIKTPPETIEMANQYLVIYTLGVVTIGLYNIISGILRGLGDSFVPLLILIACCLLNVGLDVWFVAGLGMKVAGAALATVLSQAFSSVLCIVRLIALKNIVRLKPRNFLLKKDILTGLLKLGLPSGITQMIFSFAMITVQSLTNSMGYQVVTCTTAVMRVDGFAMLPNFTFGMAIMTFIGQNIGANDIERVKQGSKDIIKIALTASVILVACVVIFGRYLIEMFTQTEEIIRLGTRQLRILAVGYIAMCFTQVYGGIMRGAGDTMPSMWISIFTSVVIRIPLAYLLAYLTRSERWPNGSPDAIFFSLLIVWVLGAVITYLWYRRGKWMNKRVAKAKQPIPTISVEEQTAE